MIFSDVERALLALPLAISDSGRNTALPHLTIMQLWKMPFSLKCRRKDTKKANRQHDHEFVAFLGIKIGEQPLFFCATLHACQRCQTSSEEEKTCIIGSAEALPILCVSDFCERERERERERRL